MGHSLPFSRCKLNCSPRTLPGLQLKTSATFLLCAASCQKNPDIAVAQLNLLTGALLPPSPLSSGFLQRHPHQSQIVHRRKGLALKAAANSVCQYPEQDEGPLIICHCLFNYNTVSQKGRGRNGGKKGRKVLKVWQTQPPNTGGSDSESQSQLAKAFKNPDGD